MYNLQKYMCMVLDDLKSNCMTGLDTKTRSNTELNRYTVLSSYYCDTSEGKNVHETRPGLSVRRVGF